MLVKARLPSDVCLEGGGSRRVWDMPNTCVRFYKVHMLSAGAGAGGAERRSPVYDKQLGSAGSRSRQRAASPRTDAGGRRGAQCAVRACAYSPPAHGTPIARTRALSARARSASIQEKRLGARRHRGPEAKEQLRGGGATPPFCSLTAYPSNRILTPSSSSQRALQFRP